MVRERHAGINPLGLATVFIFFTCATGHALHAEHYLLFPAVYARDDALWHQLLVDGITIVPAMVYLTQRRRFGFVIRGQHALLDFQRRLDVSEALRRIAEDLAAQTDLGTLLKRIAEHAKGLVPGDYAMVIATDHFAKLRSETTGLVNHWDLDTCRLAVCFPEEPGLDEARWSPKPLLINNLHRHPTNAGAGHALHLAEQARAVLIVPIAQGTEVLGALLVGRRSKRQLTQDDVSRVSALASQSGMAIENTRLIEGLRQAERLKDELLSAAAHELKTPVTTIRGHTQRWLRDGRGCEPESLEAVLRQTERINRLTTDLLAALRLPSAAIDLKTERFDLGRLVRDSVGGMTVLASDGRFEVRGSNVAWVDADKQLIGEVVRRLLENAVRYSDEGVPVEVQVDRAGQEVVVSVRDTGVGIPVERQSHVFEPFYEPVPSGQQGYVGLVSLGLFVSKRVIDAHQGKIWFTSSPGNGSTFSFSLRSANPIP